MAQAMSLFQNSQDSLLYLPKPYVSFAVIFFLFNAMFPYWSSAITYFFEIWILSLCTLGDIRQISEFSILKLGLFFLRRPWIRSFVLDTLLRIWLLSNIVLKVEVEYADGTKFNFSSEFLRVHSPAADGKVRSIGGEKVIG